jgi:phosphoribosylformylglycinamidine synthase subunit PurL
VPLAPADGAGSLFALGTATPLYDGSEWQALEAGENAGRIPETDLPALRWLCDLLAELAPTGLVRSAHDVSDGGLAVALAEIALAAGTGLEVTLDPGEGSAEAAVFGECCGLAIVSIADGDEERLARACDAAGVPCERIGSLGGPAIALRCGGLALALTLEDARAAYTDALPTAMAAR